MKITWAKIREDIWAWLGWLFIELVSVLDSDKPGAAWRWRWLGGAFWYSLGNYCYHRAYHPGEPSDVIWPWSKDD